MITVFEQAGYKNYADEVRKMFQLTDINADDSYGSGEEHPTYPVYKQEKLSQLPPAATESDEVYVMMGKENPIEGKSW